jgi:hypothetical protein
MSVTFCVTPAAARPLLAMVAETWVPWKFRSVT